MFAERSTTHVEAAMIRRFAFLIQMLAVSATAVAAERATAADLKPVPPQQIALYAQAKAHLPPATRAKLQAIEPAILARIKSSPHGDPAAIARAGVAPAAGSAPGSDAGSLAYIVLVDAANENSGDISAKISAMQNASGQKQTLRDQAGATRSPLPSPSAKSNALSDVSEQDSMQLQMMMSTRNDLLQAISNLEKSVGDTQNAIISNMKQ
jgi:hypothetical protein